MRQPSRSHLLIATTEFTMRGLIKPRRTRLLLAGFLVVAFAVAWIYWNRQTRTNMAAYAPADCLAFVEANDLPEVAQGIEGTQAWKALAGLALAQQRQWCWHAHRWRSCSPARKQVRPGRP